MDIFFGFMFFIVAMLCIYTADTLDDKISKYLYFIAAFGFIVLAIVKFVVGINNLVDEPKQYDYSASEYKLSIKTITINSQTDTTYVITEIK